MSTEAFALTPHNPAEEGSGHPAANVEKSYREIGKENRAALNKKIDEKKGWLSGMLNKFKAFAADKKESAIDHAFAVPTMIADANEAGGKKIDAMEEKFVQGTEAVGRGAEWVAAYAKYKTVEGAKAVDQGLVDLQEKAHKKIYEVSSAVLDMKDKAGIAVQNELDAWKRGPAEVKQDLIELKNDIKAGAEKLAVIGIGATMVAGEKVKSLWGNLKDFANRKRLESVMKKEDELKKKLAETLKKKMELTHELFGNAAAA